MLEYFSRVNGAEPTKQRFVHDIPSQELSYTQYGPDNEDRRPYRYRAEDRLSSPHRYSHPRPVNQPGAATKPRIEYFTPDDFKPERRHKIEAGDMRLPLGDIFNFGSPQRDTAYDIFQKKEHNMPRLVPKPRLAF